MSEEKPTYTPLPAPLGAAAAEKLLSAAELDAIGLFRSAYLAGMRRHEHALDAYNRHIPALLSHIDALAARLREAEAATELLIQETHRWSDAEKRDKERHQAELNKLAARLTTEQAARAEQERQLLVRDEELRGLRLVAAVAENALGRCYDVAEWPADGSTSQDIARKALQAVLAHPGAGEAQGEGVQGA